MITSSFHLLNCERVFLQTEWFSKPGPIDAIDNCVDRNRCRLRLEGAHMHMGAHAHKNEHTHRLPGISGDDCLVGAIHAVNGFVARSGFFLINQYGAVTGN